jgi:hypothetical protein
MVFNNKQLNAYTVIDLYIHPQMRSNLLNLSNIANILPYYGEYEKKRTLVEELRPTLLPNFASILEGIFSNAEYDELMFMYHKKLY